MYVEWIEMGLAQPGKSKGALAKAMGVSASAVSLLLQGRRQIKAQELPLIAEYLELPVPVQHNPQQSHSQKKNSRPDPVLFDTLRTMPLYASAEGGSGTIIRSIDPIEYIPRPYPLQGIEEAYGIVIEGESMVEAYRPGDTAYVNPIPGPRRETDCIFYQISAVDEPKATIKRLITWNDMDWIVQQYNPPKRFKLKRAEWQTCHRVIGKINRP